MLVNRVHKPYLCRICGNASGIKICKCQKAYYCSKNCQKIDWKVHKSDCYKLVDHPNSSKNFPNNSFASSNSASQAVRQEQQQNLEATIQSHVQAVREGRQYDPTPLQYQQQSHSTNTMTPSTIDDFEENLFNSLMYSVDESTEKEILKNLNHRADEHLTVYTLTNENSTSLDDQALRQFQALNPTDDESFNDQVFEQIQRQQSFEFKPETQQLLKETRDSLEKELSLFREINLHEPQHQLDDDDSGSDIMQINSNNPKYINHTRLDDHLLYK